jgi:AcrR family transcriptional regulator
MSTSPSVTRKSIKLAAPSSPWTGANKRAEQRELKRQAVLSTAAQLFNEQGFQATSLDDIAARLNVSKPTLYYYVKNKDEILIECVRGALQTMLEGIEQTRASGGKAIDQLITCMRIYTRIVTQDFGMCVIRISDTELPADRRAELRALKSGIDQAFRRQIKACVKEKSIAKCDPKLTAFMVAGALCWIGQWYQPGGSLSPDKIADEYIRTFMQGLKPASSASS